MPRYFDLIKNDGEPDAKPLSSGRKAATFNGLTDDTLHLTPLKRGIGGVKGLEKATEHTKGAVARKEQSSVPRPDKNVKKVAGQEVKRLKTEQGSKSKKTKKKVTIESPHVPSEELQESNQVTPPSTKEDDVTTLKSIYPHNDKGNGTDFYEKAICRRDTAEMKISSHNTRDAARSLEDEGLWLRAAPINEKAVRTRVHQNRIGRRNEQLQSLNKFYSKTRLLNVEDSGFAAVDSDDDHPLVKSSSEITQKDIRSSADLLTRSKQFDLNLDQFGPYSVDYTRNGRHLLLYGDKGHIAAFDWQTKKLHFEINVMEKIRHARWLHNESFLAVAQNRWTYVYDQLGVEIHCLKTIDKAFHLEFLPYHFLLVALTVNGFVKYLDVSTGVIVASYPIWQNGGRVSTMTTCPSNAVTLTGHNTGNVQFWSPSVKEPLVTLFAHRSPVHALLTDSRGSVLATVGTDKKVKLWDLRTYKLMTTHPLGGVPASIAFSQTGLFAAAFNRHVKVFSNFCSRERPPFPELYMEHIEPARISSCQFCPFEDVLGVGHQNGFSSLIIPGSGEANFDGYEVNPYESKKQKRNSEVRALLEKIPYEMISLDNSALTQVNVKEALAGEDPAAPRRLKVVVRKSKRGKRVKIGMQLLAKKKVRAMMIREIQRGMKPVPKEKKKTRKDFMAEDPIFGRFKTTK